MRKKIFIVGGTSSIGNSLRNFFSKNYNVVYSCRVKEKRKFYYIDLAESLNNVKISENFDYIFFCAGISSMKLCKENPTFAYKINVENTFNLIERFVELGSKIIFFSTNLVFNGLNPFPDEKCNPSPLCEYGRLKFETEKKIIGLSNNVSIVRLSKVIDRNMQLFDRWKNQFLLNEKVKAFINYKISPISMNYLSNAMGQLLRNWTPGILHLSSHDEISYFEVAKFIAKKNGFKEDLVDPQTVECSDLFMDSIPYYVSLDMRYTAKMLNINIPSFHEALSFYNR